MPELVVNADGLGRHTSTTDAILQAYQQGIVTSTTVLVNLPDSPAALERVLTEAPELAIGLELNLTRGAPLSSGFQPLAEGRFYSRSALPEQIAGLSDEVLVAEIQAQYARFVELTGKVPTHLSAYYHMPFLLPAALNAILDIADAQNLPLRELPLDEEPVDLYKKLERYLHDVPEAFVRTGIESAQDILRSRAQQPAMPARFASRFYPPLTTLGDLLNILTVLPLTGPVELMCQPALSDDPAVYEAQFAALALESLTHTVTHEVVETFQIQLVTFGKLIQEQIHD